MSIFWVNTSWARATNHAQCERQTLCFQLCKRGSALIKCTKEFSEVLAWLAIKSTGSLKHCRNFPFQNPWVKTTISRIKLYHCSNFKKYSTYKTHRTPTETIYHSKLNFDVGLGPRFFDFPSVEAAVKDPFFLWGSHEWWLDHLENMDLI